ncbi:MAG: dTDP-4-dehydrorhamnose 3,5-epimerase [Desulfovibrionales bacterium]|nr:dTDP-4-dehydrorhamnose 3,5-epimerase [Desulfovibrionales bacterium]
MNVTLTDIPGVLLIKPNVFGDHRGSFCETYSRRQFAAHGLDIDFVQDNQVISTRAGVLRGLHFQIPPMAQAKLVRVTRGAVFDVVVDLRKGSATFGKWQGFTLSAENFLQLLVPKGMAHGYMTLTGHVEFLYKVDAPYAPGHEGGIRWNDPDLNIAWPDLPPILSDKDLRLPLWAESGIQFSI